MGRLKAFLPLIALLGFVALVGWRLANPDDQRIASGMTGQPVPAFQAARAIPEVESFGSADLADGQPRLINIFASWCVPCIAEAPQLVALREAGVALDGIALRDRSEDVADFLERTGVRFDRVTADPASRVQLAFGATGVPESFLVDGRGIIRYQHIGPIEAGDVADIVRRYEALK